LKWDEENLIQNEREAHLNPKMKIDEPKTPFRNGIDEMEDDKGGESHEGSFMSPSNSKNQDGHGLEMIDDARLQGFSELETDFRQNRAVGSEPSTGTHSHSSEDFARMRKMHYHDEFVRLKDPMADIDEDDDADADANADEETRMETESPNAAASRDSK